MIAKLLQATSEQPETGKKNTFFIQIRNLCRLCRYVYRHEHFVSGIPYRCQFT